MIIRGLSRGFILLMYNSKCLPMRAMRNRYAIRGPLWIYIHLLSRDSLLYSLGDSRLNFQTIYLYYNHNIIITLTPHISSPFWHQWHPVWHWWQFFPTISPFVIYGNNFKSLFPFDINDKGWTKFFHVFPQGLCWIPLSICFLPWLSFVDHFFYCKR